MVLFFSRLIHSDSHATRPFGARRRHIQNDIRNKLTFNAADYSIESDGWKICKPSSTITMTRTISYIKCNRCASAYITTITTQITCISVISNIRKQNNTKQKKSTINEWKGTPFGPSDCLPLTLLAS